MNDIDVSKRIIKTLNEALKLDKSAVVELLETRVPCNEDLANHPTIQVTHENKVGLLDILNGIVGVKSNGWGYITAVFKDADTPEHEAIDLDRFCIIDEEGKEIELEAD